MLAREMIIHAAHKAGLCTSAKINPEVYAYGFKALNRAWLWVWNAYPFRGAKIPDLTVSTDESVLVLPPDVEGIRSMRKTDGALYPLNDVLASDHNVEAWLTGSVAARWINLPDRPCPAHPNTLLAAMEAEAQEIAGGAIPGEAVRSFAVSLSLVYPDAAPSVYIKDKLGTRLALTNGMSGDTLAGMGEIDQIYLTGHVFRMTADFVLTYTVDDEPIASVTENFCTVYNADKAAYRAVRLVPAPVAGEPVTLSLNALRRFVPMLDATSALALPDTENAVFDYLVAEMHELNGEHELARAERDKAMSEMTSVIERTDGNRSEKEDVSALPEGSLFGE